MSYRYFSCLSVVGALAKKLRLVESLIIFLLETKELHTTREAEPSLLEKRVQNLNLFLLFLENAKDGLTSFE